MSHENLFIRSQNAVCVCVCVCVCGHGFKCNWGSERNKTIISFQVYGGCHFVSGAQTICGGRDPDLTAGSGYGSEKLFAVVRAKQL